MAAPIKSMRDVLEAAVPRPAEVAPRSEKKNYAERLSRQLATWLANALRRYFPGISPDPKGGAQEKPARTGKGVKKLDVNYSTPELGLGLGVSIKTINYRDPKTRRYTKNYTRVDNELRAEAKDYHERQPYAVMIAIVFLPSDCCADGSASPSSFGSAVQHFRHRTGRTKATNEQELFERVFIGVYDEATADAWFFDVREDPPRNGPPKAARRIDFDELIAAIREAYDARNNPPFRWATNGDDV